MRHEVGHNLGLYHNGSTNIGSGFAHPLGSTAMGGNNINFILVHTFTILNMVFVWVKKEKLMRLV